MTLAERRAQFGPILRAAFVAEGLPGEWGMAIAHQESDFNADAQVLTAGDGRRGGSYGLCQMSLATAKGDLGYTGDGEGLKDPQVNARLAAQYCALLTKRIKSQELRDIAAAYNSGRPFSKAPKVTRTKYVPQVLAYAEQYAAEDMPS
jgi:soluble lytic murein transglycosylase-like protein